jgi:hypothetical protein
MKFIKLDNINLRNDINQYLLDFISFNNYNVYLGLVNNYNAIVVTTYTVEDEFFIKDYYKITYNNHNIKEDQIDFYLNNQTHEKFVEIFGKNIYVRLPISNDFIDWLKADIELFTETKELYKNISLPYINSVLEKNTKWIHDLLFNKSEEKLVLFRNSNFVIAKDIIWKNSSKNEFYILVIPTTLIRTIRDLDSSHVELLKQMKSKAIEIASTFGLSENKLYFYFHYHPSYYQLHLHVVIVGHPLIENKLYRHYFLDDIINKLESSSSESNYWANCDLKFELMSCTKLYKLLKENC